MKTWNSGAGQQAAILGLTLLLVAQSADAWQRGFTSRLDNNATPWNYSGDTGPEAWGSLGPGFSQCAEGREQSPIDIRSDELTQGHCEPLRFRYRSSALYASNSAQGLRMDYEPGSEMLVGNERFGLLQIVVRTPSEHRFNGEQADGELQFIHQSDSGEVAILSVSMRKGMRVNHTLRRVLDYVPNQGHRFEGRNVGINAMFLIPSRKDYVAYLGSITEPPCEESVRWFVLKEPLEVNSYDFERLVDRSASNARPVQPLGDRQVASHCP